MCPPAGALTLKCIAGQVIAGIAELHVDRADPLEIVSDVELVGHAHSTMKLDSLFGDELRGISALRLCARSDLGNLRLATGKTEVQILRQRCRFLERDKHVDHPVLQHLKRSKWNAELLAGLGVFKSRRIQFTHGSQGFRTEGRDGPITASFEYGHALAFVSEQMVGRYFDP